MARSAYLHLRNPARCTQQLVLPLAPLVQLGRAHGVAAQVQERLGSLAEAFTGKWKLRSLRTEKLSIWTPFIDVGRATVPLGRLASGSWSQLSTPTLDKTRPLLAGTMESINVYGQKSSAACEMTRRRRWFPK